MLNNLKNKTKHLHICDFVTFDDCQLVKHHKPTLRHEIVEDSVLINEISDEKSPFSYQDFSLKTIIESGNFSLLNPVGNIQDTNLEAHDKVNYNADRIENYINNNETIE